MASLQGTIAQQDKLLDIYHDGIVELERYINSSKFDHDTTVQVRDISLRLTEIRLELIRNS